MSDLRQEVDANYSFGVIKMWHDGPRRNEVGVIVEAKSDEKFYGRFFSNSCVFFSFNGWEKALKTQELTNKYQIYGICTIIDADFKRIFNSIPEEDNLLLSDHHDKEMMMINSRAWEETLDYYGDSNKTREGGESKLATFERSNNSSTKDVILLLCKPIASLRFLSQRDKLDLKFRIFSKGKYKYLDYSKFIDKNNLTLNESKLLKAVEDKSSKAQFFKNNPDKTQTFHALQEQDFDLLEFCNGHDFVNIFSIALEKTLSNKISSSKVSSEEIERSLILAYRFEDFEATNLYQNLIAWENANEAFQLFPINDA